MNVYYKCRTGIRICIVYVCCCYRFWDGWFEGSEGTEVIIPDVSRVYRKAYEGLSEQADFLQELFNRERITNLLVYTSA